MGKLQNHNYNFEGGEKLTRIGASWFVSYTYYCLLDPSHLNWKNVKTYKYRISTYNNCKSYHAFWLTKIIEMNETKISTNKIGLSGNKVIDMAKLCLKILQGDNSN